MKSLKILAVILVLAAFSFATTGKTVQNLQAAYNGESNASARYTEFAKQADKDGYPGVASLFRAAAKAEQIHAANHAKVIQKLGAKPEAKIDKVDVKSTAENLAAAIKGESYERDVMYPEFLKQARAEGNKDAIETFNFAKSAEAEHARLYTENSKQLPTLKGKAVTYYVCTVCGYTTTKLDFSKCVVCFSPKDKYITVS